MNMHIIAQTKEFFAEHEAGLITITRRDGRAKAMKALGHVGEFRKCVRESGALRTINTYLKIMRNANWEPLYKARYAASILDGGGLPQSY